jgi:hypothetical protein
MGVCVTPVVYYESIKILKLESVSEITDGSTVGSVSPITDRNTVGLMRNQSVGMRIDERHDKRMGQ